MVDSIIIPYRKQVVSPPFDRDPLAGHKKIGHDLIIVDFKTAGDYHEIMRKVEDRSRWNKPPLIG